MKSIIHASKHVVLMLTIVLLTMSCRNTSDKAETFEDKQATIDSMKIEMDKQKVEIARQKSIDSMQAVMKQQEKSQTVVIRDQTTAAPAAEQKKGWSGAAKGAVIGAGVGAVTGAVIDKDKPGRGAVIGGLAGGGLGAGTGAILDSEKKKKEAKK